MFLLVLLSTYSLATGHGEFVVQTDVVDCIFAFQNLPMGST